MVLRTIIAINGGALVTLLALTGALVGRDKIDIGHVATLVSYFNWFVAGIVLGVISMSGVFFAYFIGTFAHSARRKTYEHPYFARTGKSAFLGNAALAVAIICHCARICFGRVLC